MASCANCGKELQAGYKFCDGCGAPVPEQPQETPTLVSQIPGQDLPQEELEQSQPQEQEAETSAAPNPCEPAPDYSMFFEQPPKRKKEWLAIVIIGAALLFLIGAIVLSVVITRGLMDSEDPNLGTYVGTTAEMFGVTTDVSEILGGPLVVELKEDGECTVALGGTKGSGTWTLEEGVITVDDGTTALVGTLEEGVMAFENVMDMDFSIVLYQQEPTESTDRSLGAADVSWWNDDWYGWWTVSNCDGEFTEWEGGWWDCCAAIEVDNNGQGELLLWDEDLPKDDPLAEIEIAVYEEERSGPMGSAAVAEGYFLDMDVSEGDITFEPNLEAYENLLVLEGSYVTIQGSFDFQMYLRPWGQDWADLAQEDEELLPFFYEDYRKAVENGEEPPENIYEAWGKKPTLN